MWVGDERMDCSDQEMTSVTSRHYSLVYFTYSNLCVCEREQRGSKAVHIALAFLNQIKATV